VTAAAPLTPLLATDVARIVVEPGATPVTVPVAFTDAIAAFAELHVTAVFTPGPLVVTDALKTADSPTLNVAGP
jgi:hypothetical protein